MALKYGRIAFTHKQIVETSKELGAIITEKYKDSSNLVIVGLLKSAICFMAELMKHIKLDFQIDFITATSYEGSKSTGELKIIMDLSLSIKNKNVILVEDICETGITLSTVYKHLKQKQPKSITSVVLLDKPSGRKVFFQPDFKGFDAPPFFVVGFGFDNGNGYLRNLPFIAEFLPKN